MSSSLIRSLQAKGRGQKNSGHTGSFDKNPTLIDYLTDLNFYRNRSDRISYKLYTKRKTKFKTLSYLEPG